MLSKKLLALIGTAALVGCVPEIEIDAPQKEENIDVIKTYFNGNNAFVYTRDIDNTTGSAAIVNLDELEVLQKGVGEGDWFSNDVVFQSDDRFIYIIDRTNANITVVDPLNSGAELTQISVGAGTNPKAVVRISDKLYITRYDSTEVLVLDANDFSEITTIDLSFYSSPDDPYPEMSNAVTAEGKVWIALERLDRNNYWAGSTQPVEGAYVVSIDPDTDKVVDEVKLLGNSPWQLLKVDPATGNLYTVTSDSSYANGIELIDPQNGTSAGWLLEPGEFAQGIFFATATTESVFVVSGEGFQGFDVYDWDYSVLWAIARPSGDTVEVARSDAGYFGLSCLELSPGNLLLSCAGPGTRVTIPGLRVFDADSLEELTSKPLDTGLPPFGVAFFERPVTEVVSVPVDGGSPPTTDTTE